MKKRFVFLVLVIYCLFNVFAQSSTVKKSTQADNNSKIIVTGYVLSQGNDPFVYPGILGDDGNKYTIICTEKQKRTLLDLQGRHLRFTLVQNDQITYVLKKYKVIKN